MSCVIQHSEILLAQTPLLNANLKTIVSDEDPPKANVAIKAYCKSLDYYLELSTLLDPILPSHVNQLCSAFEHRMKQVMAGAERSLDSIEVVSTAIYSLSKVRSVKPFSTHLPHEVRHLRFLLPVLHYSCQPENHCSWRVRHVVFLWASVAIRAPFPLVSIVTPATIDQAIKAAQSTLQDPSTVADVAVLFLARLLARRDTTAEREAIIASSTEEIQKTELPEICASSLSFLAAVFKHAHRDDLAPYIAPILSVLHEIEPTTSVQAHRVAKLAHRLALAFLPPRPANWRYSRITPHLLPSANDDANHSNPAGENNNQFDVLGEDAEISEEDADRLGAIVDLLFESLNHNDAVVRYSAAKGIARLAARLPQSHAFEVVEGVLEMVSSDQNEARADAAAHGGCLAVAELTRRGLLLPNDGQLGRALRAVREAARFELRRTAASVGAHVRDAACYAIWAVARAYDRSDVEPFVPLIIQAMIPVALLDREVNCRRAASAALQECVGRLSEHVFPDGISLITIADYFSLGDRNAAFVTVTPKVAALGDGTYVPCIIDELWSSKLFHWDSSIRSLAAKSLAELVKFDVKTTIVNELIPEMVVRSTKRGDAAIRHGAVLGLAELIVKVGSAGLKDLALETRRIPMVLNDKGYYHGRTGDEMRIASCLLIRNLASYGSEVYTIEDEGHHDAEDSMKIVERFLSSGKEKMYAEATESYEAMFERVISLDSMWHMNATRRVMNGLRESPHAEFQRGFALSLGSCGLSKLTPRVVETLCDAIRSSKDVEVRRNAGISLAKIPLSVLQSMLVVITAALGCGMRDYATDDRGDVGSWVREASMTSFASIIERVLLKNADQPQEWDIKTASEALRNGLENVIFECCGRIDRTRVVAGKTMKRVCGVLTSQSLTVNDESLNKVRSICEKLNQIYCFRHEDGRKDETEIESEVEFENGNFSFPAMKRALSIDEVRPAVMRGFVAAGGGTRSQFKAPCQALVEFFCEFPTNDGCKAEELKRAVLLPIENRDSRLMIPALTVIGALARNGALDGIESDTLSQIVREIRASWRGQLRDVRLILSGMAAVQNLMTLSLSDEDGDDGGSFTFAKGTVGREGLEALMVILGCGIPRLRSAAAEAIYIALITCDIDGYGHGCPDGVLKAVDILLDTPWKLVEVKEVRSTRNELCRLLEIAAPTIVSKPSTTRKHSKPTPLN